MKAWTPVLDDLVDSVEGFRSRFALTVSRDPRMNIASLTEELGEYAHAINHDEPGAVDELADLLYGTLEALMATGMAGPDAVLRVIQKNNAKTRRSHGVGPGGKIVALNAEEVG